MNVMVKCYLYGRNPKREVVKLLRWVPIRDYVPGAPLRFPLNEARSQYPGLTFEWASSVVESPRGWGIGQQADQLLPAWSLSRAQLPLTTGDVVLFCGPLLTWVEVSS